MCCDLTLFFDFAPAAVVDDDSGLAAGEFFASVV
jgi:hypothetical protein